MKLNNIVQVNKGALICKFDIEFENMGLTIRECTLMSKGTESWLGMPSRQYDKDGQKKYFNLVVWSDEKKKELEKKVKELLNPQPSVFKADENEIPF